MNFMISSVQIPNNPEENTQNNTVWSGNKLLSVDCGKTVYIYIYHEDNIWYDENSREEKTITTAYQIHVEKPITEDKIILAAVMDAFNLYSREDYISFQAKLMRESQENPENKFTQDYYKFVDWIKNGLILAKGITTEDAKAIVNKKIQQYDTSDAVNSFILNGSFVWLDKNTRVGLMNSITLEKMSGLEYTTLWLGTKNFTLPINTAMNLLMELELYAKECYNITAQHRLNVNTLSDSKEILEYDYTKNYPEKLIITI